jgi:uncharacterized protein YebE (UPF0316 family)
MSTILETHGYWLMPTLIFFSRITDVTIGTIRIIFLSRGYKILVPIFAFFEVLVWLLATTHIMQNLDSWPVYIAYALGFTVGNVVGLQIEERLAIGLLSLWIISKHDAGPMLEELQQKHYGITRVAARGLQGKVRILIMVISRKKLRGALEVVQRHDPTAFITVNDVRNVEGGFFSIPHRANLKFPWEFLGMRKGK